MAERAEGETRADVARRLRKADRPKFGPSSYEIGSDEDPDA
jgi:GTP-binding protein